MNKRRRDARRVRLRRKRVLARKHRARPIDAVFDPLLIERVKATRDARHTAANNLAREVAAGLPRAVVAPSPITEPEPACVPEPMLAPASVSAPEGLSPPLAAQRLPDRIALLPERARTGAALGVSTEPFATSPAAAANALQHSVLPPPPPLPPAAPEARGSTALAPSHDALAQPAPATGKRLGLLVQPLLLPVALAAVIVVLSNHFAPTFRPGTHLAPAPVSPVNLSETGDSTRDGAGLAAIAPLPADTAITASASAPQIAATDARDGAIAARETDFLPRTRACAISEIAATASAAVPADQAAFGRALASAAQAQTRDFVIYKDEYYNIRYPGGDIPALYGVCSDVVIRAYRQLGIDLQKLVHEARVGSGDSSIDHRRTETLRRFFARHAERLPVTDYAEDFLPGDIVTYERPQNRGAQAHIAIVADEIGPSGRPMIVHNRGWGPQMEDALFVDHMTGHYRLSAQPRLLTSWGRGQSLGQGMESWATLVRRAAIQRGASRTPKEQAKRKAGQNGAGSGN